MREKFVVVLTFMVLGVSIFSLQTAHGQTLISLFDIDSGVRPLGIGGAFTGLADDENTIFYNPAGLGFLRGLHLGSFYEPRFGANFGSLALVRPGLGGGFLFLSLGGLTQYDEADRPGKTFGYGSYGLIASLALRPNRLLHFLPSTIALGMNAKFLGITTIAEGSGSGLALDWGLLWDLGRLGPVKALRFGLLIENLPSLKVKYKGGYKESWKVGFRFGGSIQMLDSLILAFDLERNGTFHFGGEYGLGLRLGQGIKGLKLRVGGFTRGGFVPTLGLGLEFRSFRVDYAFIAYSQAPETHRLSFSVDLSSF